ncbi:MAG: hypothetical protein ABFD25_10560 [Clostridiaceae bacterium]
MLKFSKITIFIISVLTMSISAGYSDNTAFEGKTGLEIEKTISKADIEDENNKAGSKNGEAAEEAAGSAEADQQYAKLFELNLYSDETTYKTTDKITIWATLKYIGENEKIKIWHADPYISFTITDGKDFNTGGAFDEILATTELEKGQLYRFDFSKSGGFTAEDPKAEFWKKFYAEKDLYLPEGEYTVKVSTAFSLTENIGESKCSLSKEFLIKVK